MRQWIQKAYKDTRGNAFWEAIKALWEHYAATAGGTAVIGGVVTYVHAIPFHDRIGYSAIGLGALIFVCGIFKKRTPIEDNLPAATATITTSSTNQSGGITAHTVNISAPEKSIQDAVTEALKKVGDKVVKSSQSKSEMERLRDKYKWGFRIFGVDKFGGTHTYLNRFSQEFEMDWDAIEVTMSLESGRFKVELPSIKYAPSGIDMQKATFEGAIKTGESGGVILGDMSIYAEILELADAGIVMIIGASEDNTTEMVKQLHRHVKMAEAAIDRYHDSYIRPYSP